MLLLTRLQPIERESNRNILVARTIDTGDHIGSAD